MDMRRIILSFKGSCGVLTTSVSLKSLLLREGNFFKVSGLGLPTKRGDSWSCLKLERRLSLLNEKQDDFQLLRGKARSSISPGSGLAKLSSFDCIFKSPDFPLNLNYIESHKFLQVLYLCPFNDELLHHLSCR